MNTSRSDDTSAQQTLGERMVRVARMMAVEHVRQAAEEAGIDLAEVQRQLREQTVRQDLYESPAATPIATSQPMTIPPRPTLPQRPKATRRPPSGAMTTATSPRRREAA